MNPLLIRITNFSFCVGIKLPVLAVLPKHPSQYMFVCRGLTFCNLCIFLAGHTARITGGPAVRLCPLALLRREETIGFWIRQGKLPIFTHRLPEDQVSLSQQHLLAIS